MLLVGREKISSGNYKIYSIDINEKNINMGDYVAKSKSFIGNTFAHSGDDNARTAIKAFLSKENFTKLNNTKLDSLADATIQIGISKSGSLTNFPNTKSCGGIPMILHV